MIEINACINHVNNNRLNKICTTVTFVSSLLLAARIKSTKNQKTKTFVREIKIVKNRIFLQDKNRCQRPEKLRFRMNKVELRVSELR